MNIQYFAHGFYFNDNFVIAYKIRNIISIHLYPSIVKFILLLSLIRYFLKNEFFLQWLLINFLH